KSGNPSLRPIEELIRDDDMQRRVLLLETAHGARRNDAFDAQRLEPEDVGSEVQLRGKQAVPRTMPRQKGDTPAAEGPDQIRAGRIAKRRLERLPLAVGQLRHVIEAATADHTNLNIHVTPYPPWLWTLAFGLFAWPKASRPAPAVVAPHATAST